MTTPAAAESTRRRVLLAEDSLVERLRLRAILEKAGYEVEEAEDGQQALERLRREFIPLVVSDWQMPRMDGLELCRQIRQDLKRADCYFLMLTGRSSREDLLEAFASGTDDFLTKPVDRDELLARLRVGERLYKLQADLASQYHQAQEALQREQQARALVDADLAAASLLQKELLPARYSSRPGLDIAHLFRPAAGLGGDMLNHLRLDEHTVGFFLLDVCGHGVAPSLLSFAVAHSLSEMFGEVDNARDLKPEHLLQILNRRFLDRSGNSRYFTIVLGIIDLTSGRARICQAAHPPPLLLRADGRMEKVPGGGLPVGVFEQAEFESTEVVLQPGDRLIVFSDGLTECEDAHLEQFGEARLQQTLTEVFRHGPEHMLEHLRDKLLAWQGSDQLEDDLSILILARSRDTAAPRLELDFQSNATEIATAVDALREWLETAEIDQALGFQFAVCVTEALNNIEEHGYGEATPGPIAMRCHLRSDAIECELMDRAPSVEQTPAAELSPGDVEDGRGWFILKAWMDRVEYAPTVTGNCLRLVKFFNTEAQA